MCLTFWRASKGTEKSKQTMPTYKLTYFPARNLGEAIRLSFHYAGVPFEDFKVPFDKWPTEYKHKTPYGTLPILTIDNCELCESTTILRYVGRKFNLVKSTYEEAKVDELLQVHASEYGRIKPYVLAATGFEKGDPVELLESVGVPCCKFYFPKWSKILKETGTGFLVGQTPTPADFFLADYLHTLLKLAPKLFDGHTDLKYFVERIYGLPQLKSYIATRLNSAL